MKQVYRDLQGSLCALMEGVPYETANLANAAALLWDRIPDLNWAGFYKVINGRLVLGPFQGKPACIVIPLGKGVCGTAAQTDKVLNVPNVHEFAGHIVCDCASNSEIVIPLHVNGAVWGVLDIDSPLLQRFSEEEQLGLVECAAEIEKMLAYVSEFTQA